MRRITVALAALALIAVACGRSETAAGVASLEGSATTTTTALGADPVETEEAVLAFAACLRAEGLDVADPEFDGDGGFDFNFGEIFRGGDGEGPPEEFLDALEVCRELLEGIGQRFQRGDQTELQDNLLAFAECMRGEGVDMPDPDFSGFDNGPGEAGRGPFGAIDLDDPTVEAAFETCQSGFGGPGGPGGFGRGGGDDQ